MHLVRALPTAAAIALLAACSSTDEAPLPLAPATSQVSASTAVGQVYTMTNAAAGNAILAFDRAANGSLTPAGSFATNGLGTGAGLGNQNGVIISSTGRVLLAVNAASNDITTFRIRADGSLQRVGSWASGGTTPISLTEWGGIVYVLNAGGAGGIAGFRLKEGELSPIPGSVRPLSGAGVGPAQVQFARNGKVLIVTEKATNRLTSYTVDAQGVASAPIVNAAAGATPFGFAVRNGLLFVSEAFGGAADASAVSSYEVSGNGSVHVISPSVHTTETAACWVVVTGDGRFAYTTNAGSSTISGYAITGGKLTLLDANGVTASTSSTPIDMALSRNSQFLYTLTANGHAIDAFAIGANGSLTPVAQGVSGLPVGTNGLAAR